MRRNLISVGSTLIGALLVYACSAGDAANGPEGAGANGSGANGSGANGSGTGGKKGDIQFGTGGENSGSGGETPVVDPGPVVLPEPDPCSAEGTCNDGFVCTISNVCGAIGTECSSHSDCQGDSYCCDKDCRKDGMDAGICIPANVGPGTAASCKGDIEIGVFGPAVQCEWKGTDAFGSNVATTPLVADLPFKPDQSNLSIDVNAPIYAYERSAEIVFISFAGKNADTDVKGSLRIVRGDTCELIETIEDSKNLVRANTTPALADLDGDGKIEIVAYKIGGGLISFKWDGSAYKKFWESAQPNVVTAQFWGGIAIHNLDDGTPEIIAASKDKVYTFNGATGAQLGNPIATAGSWNGFIPVVGDFDKDGVADLISNEGNGIVLYHWKNGAWGDRDAVIQGVNPAHFAFADFGSPAAGGGWDETVLDGIAEIVKTEDVGDSRVGIYSLTGEVVMNVKTAGSAPLESGGAPVIGDFDNDGLPEIGVAGATRFRVFDLGCKGKPQGCEAEYVRWSQASQDASSRQTGASIFDFDGDGKAEAVYADECFLRVYEGDTGKVLFSSYRTSGTWFENPVVADVDKDQNTEIVVNSAFETKCPSSSAYGTPYVDPLHPGVACKDDTNCASGGTCSDGYCRCANDGECDAGSTCASPLPGTGAGNTCRATHPNQEGSTGGIKVLRDGLDRWTSSKGIWNQHAYSDTNINEDGSVPPMMSWEQNFSSVERNNYRQNSQGKGSPNDLPDVTGALDKKEVCKLDEQTNKTILTGRVCNRGNKAVGAALPATFYGPDGKILCVSYTQAPVGGNGDCRAVTCELSLAQLNGGVTMVVNDDGEGGRSTVECREDNNSDVVEITQADCVVLVR